MPEGAVYVGRPTRWGNPFEIGSSVYVHAPDARGVQPVNFSIAITAGLAVYLYEVAMWKDTGTGLSIWVRLHLDELRGRDLVCWCPLDRPCHADVLLAAANEV